MTTQRIAIGAEPVDIADEGSLVAGTTYTIEVTSTRDGRLWEGGAAAPSDTQRAAAHRLLLGETYGVTVADNTPIWVWAASGGAGYVAVTDG